MRIGQKFKFINRNCMGCPFCGAVSGKFQENCVFNYICGFSYLWDGDERTILQLCTTNVAQSIGKHARIIDQENQVKPCEITDDFI